MTVPSAGWRAVYAALDVPAPDDLHRTGRCSEGQPRVRMSDSDTAAETAAERGAQSDRERVARVMAEGELDRIGDRLIGASRDSESLRETVRECRAELAAVESMLAVED